MKTRVLITLLGLCLSSMSFAKAERYSIGVTNNCDAKMNVIIATEGDSCDGFSMAHNVKKNGDHGFDFRISKECQVKFVGPLLRQAGTNEYRPASHIKGIVLKNAYDGFGIPIACEVNVIE